MADLADYYGVYDPTALDEAFLSDINGPEFDEYDDENDELNTPSKVIEIPDYDLF